MRLGPAQYTQVAHTFWFFENAILSHWTSSLKLYSECYPSSWSIAIQIVIEPTEDPLWEKIQEFGKFADPGKADRCEMISS